MIRSQVLVCGGTGCTASGSKAVMEAFESEIAKFHLEEEIKLVPTGCFGLCARGPIVIVYPEGTFYSHVQKEDVAEIVEEHLFKGRIVERLVYKDIDNDAKEEVKEKAIKYTSLNDTDFYRAQKRVALRNCGVINPESIAMDGYAALGKVLTEMTPEDVIKCISDSGLRGRGGGGFPTGRKWSLVDKGPGQKYVVCNADEGDPGAFMDRSVLEGDPHCIVEAMTICGYAIGATEGYVYVRADSSQAP